MNGAYTSMVRKQDREQIYYSTFTVAEGEEVLLNVFHVGNNLSISFQFEFSKDADVGYSLGWNTVDGVTKFLAKNVPKIFGGFARADAVQMGSIGNRPLFVELAFAKAGQDGLIMHFFLYLGGNPDA